MRTRVLEADLERFLQRLVPENSGYFTHTLEGPDDMPSHIRMVLTRSSETIPIEQGRLQLGTWQGLFVYEHRHEPMRRTLSVSIIGEPG
jgi:secondary thiamine-phosphate synthase enzyme